MTEVNNQANEESKAKMLFDLISTEINEQNSFKNRFGYSSWGLIVSIAAVVWLLINPELYKDVNAHSVILGIIGALMFRIIYSWYKNLLTPSNELYGTRIGHFRFINSIFFGQQIQIIYDLSKFILVIMIVYYVRYYLNNWQLISLYVFFGVSILGCVFTLLVMGKALPVFPFNKTETQIKSTLTVFSIYYIYLSLSIVLLSVEKMNNFRINEIKIIILLLAIDYIVEKIILVSKKDIRVENLKNIRQDFALGKIQFDAARQSVETELYGLRLSKLLEREIFSLDKIILEANDQLKVLLTLHENYCTKVNQSNSAFQSDLQSADEQYVLIYYAGKQAAFAYSQLMELILKAKNEYAVLNAKLNSWLKYSSGLDHDGALIKQIFDSKLNILDSRIAQISDPPVVNNPKFKIIIEQIQHRQGQIE